MRMFHAVHEILSMSSDFIVMLNCVESSDDDSLSFNEIAAPSVTSVAQEKVPNLFLPLPSCQFQEISRRDASVEADEEKVDKQDEYNHQKEIIPEKRDPKREIDVLHVKECPVPSSSSSPTITACSPLPPKEDCKIERKKQGGDAAKQQGSKNVELVREITAPKKKQQERENWRGSYYSVEVRDQNNNILERNVTKIDVKRKVVAKGNMQHPSFISITEKPRPAERSLRKSSTKTSTKASKATAMTETVRRMKNSYIQNEERKELNRNDRLYQHGKRSVSARRQLAKARNEELNKSAQFEKKFQEKRKASRSTPADCKQRALRLYDLSRPKQLQGRMRRTEVMYSAKKKADLRSSSAACKSRFNTSKGCYCYSISPISSGTTSSSTKSSSSSSSQEKSNSLLSDDGQLMRNLPLKYQQCSSLSTNFLVGW